MNSRKRQKDRILKEELPRSVGAQYATGDPWRNNSRKNEGLEPKQKQYPVVDVTGDRSKVRCCKQQYCIGTDENNRMGKTRDLFKKIRDTKGTFHAKMGSIKDRNGMDLTVAQDIKKKWQEYTEELYKKHFHDPDKHNGVITHLEPDILECEVKWALESISPNKASGGDGIRVELFQILKDDAVKVLHSICEQIWKTHQWPQDWKRSVFIPIPKKGNAKECSNYCTIVLISHARKVMLKILQARLQQYVNRELPAIQAGFRKGRRTRDQIANICLDHQKDKRIPEKHLFLLY